MVFNCTRSFCMLLLLTMSTDKYRTQVRLCFSAVCDFFVCASNISRTAGQICTKFTWKMRLVPRSDEFERQGQRSRSPGTKNEKQLSHTATDDTNISGTSEQICAKYTGKTCLVPRSDKFEGQAQRSKSLGTKKHA